MLNASPGVLWGEANAGAAGAAPRFILIFPTVHRMTDLASSRATLTGLACGVGAGALWGLVFLAPELARGFTPVQLAVGRFLAYGLFALALLLPRWTALRAQLRRADWWALGRLSVLGNTLYYVLLASAVQQGGIAMTSLVIGFLPVAVTVIGSREHGAVPLGRLAPSLLCGAVGVGCVGWQSLARHGGGASISLVGLSGLLCAIAAMASWTAYAVLNARHLARLPRVSTHDWNLATGAVTGAQALLMLPLALWLDARDHASADWARLAAVAAGVALAASIGGNALWNRMSRLLPLTMVGQMILFETLFALLYGFIWERRAPTAWEWTAMACVGASVPLCLRAHHPARARAVEVA
jgi:drug/metabolite transporter (DMT)-like permease